RPSCDQRLRVLGDTYSSSATCDVRRYLGSLGVGTLRSILAGVPQVGDDPTPIRNERHRAFYTPRAYRPVIARERLDHDPGRRALASPPGYRCTIEQVRVRVTPLMAWIRDTTNLPRASMLGASARTMTSWGPAQGWGCCTPSISVAARATCPALPTSVWMRT